MEYSGNRGVGVMALSARPNQTVAREGGERAAWDSEVMLSRGVVKASNDG